ncbi:hypothetical protein [Candidatus Palauibacter sp.]|uniref:hypothetical protein n=1 Tax=Candidatus Palauibacter sp. TaxID=3101350 RepID=UPI003C6F02C5
MIRYHYHTARKEIPRLGIVKGDPLCHVYSDLSREELETWGKSHGLEPAWIHDSTLPHFDAFGPRLDGCGPGVTRTELKAHIRAWRSRHRVAGVANGTGDPARPDYQVASSTIASAMSSTWGSDAFSSEGA